jgi:hypothetical protein
MFRRLENKNHWYYVKNLSDTSINDGDLWVVMGLVTTPFALSGLVMIFIFIYAIKASGLIFLFSLINIILMMVGYSKALDNKNWSLFE